MTSDMIWTGLSLLALLGWPLVALHDVLTHGPTPAAPVTEHGGNMTAQGVPYVPGVTMEG